jgi:hypothetical protein
MTHTSSEKSYFDLHMSGFGYLNRIREVPGKGKKADPYLACTIAALHGPCDSPEYCYIDARVSGADAQRLIRRCKEAVDAKSKVLLGFKVGDPWIDQFTYSKGPKVGQPGASLKARLLFISWIKVDGETVYKAEPKEARDSDQPEAQVSEANAAPTVVGTEATAAAA